MNHKWREIISDDIHYGQNIFDEALTDLNKTVVSLSGKSIQYFGLPLPTGINFAINNTEFLRETSYDKSRLLKIVTEDKCHITLDQRKVYDAIMSSLNSSEGKLFSIDAPRGTGKTLLINLLLTKVRSMGKIALAVASSGIAATLYKGKWTAHATFKIPPKNISDDLTTVYVTFLNKIVLQNWCEIVL